MKVAILTVCNTIEVFDLNDALQKQYDNATHYSECGTTIGVTDTDTIMVIGDNEKALRKVLQGIIDSGS